MEWIPAIVAVDAALQASRQYLTHAAALRLPGSEAGILVFARSGAGKTTTALGLALAGFGLLTDDATVLVPPGAMGSSEFSIWGLPRSLKVHRRTSELLPQIGGLLGPDWNAEGEQVLARGSLKGVVDVCAPAACPLAAIIMLQPRVRGGHVLEPVAKTELMVSLADDNVQRGPKGLLPDQLERFQVLAAAVAATPAYALHVGTDLPSLGALVHAVIGGAAMKRRNDASRST